MQRLTTLALCLAAAMLTSCRSISSTQKSSAENWPRFRGPNGQGQP